MARFMLNSHQLWIFGIEGSLNVDRIQHLFDEGDQVLVIGDNITTFEYNNRNYLLGFEVLSLNSVGNGSIFFERKAVCLSVDNCTLWEMPLFQEPFTDFRGRVLRISSLGSPPIKEPPLPGQHKWRGYIFQIINELGGIFNFTYVVKEADDRLYGIEQEDGSWTGLIGELIRKSVDLGVGDLSWSMERNLVIDLTLPIFPETVTFIYRAPAFYSRAWILFQDIDFRIWISLSSLMITVSCVYCITLCAEALCKNRSIQRMDASGIFVKASVRSVTSLYRLLLTQSVTHIPKSVSARTILGTWLLGSLIFSALYGGSLTSRLSLHKSPNPADSLQSLVKRYPTAILALRNNSMIHSYFKKSDYWRGLWLHNIRHNVIAGKYHIEDTMKKVHDMEEGTPIYVWIAERSMLVKQMQEYSDDNVICDLYVAKSDIARSDWSIALVRNSPFLKQFDDKIIQMQRFGLLQKWYKDHWESAQGECRPTDGLNPTGLSAISLTDTQSNFVILAFGWCASFVVLLIERVFHQLERQ